MIESLELDEDTFNAMLREIEQRFKFVFDAGEVPWWEGSVADIYAILFKHFARYRGKKCAAAMAFFRMRGFLKPLSPAKVTPDTALQPLIGRFRGARWERELTRASGLRVPALEGPFKAAASALNPFSSKAPKGYESVRDLVLKIARANFGRLAEDGARIDSNGLWEALSDVIAEQLFIEDRSRIVAGTRFAG